MPENHAKQGAGKHASHRTRTIILSLVGVLIALPVIGIIFILTFDWDRARPWLNAKTSEAIERPFEIRGHLAVKWERGSDWLGPHQRSWRDWIPWPHLIANDIHVGNPAGMPARDMANVRQLSFILNPLGLLSHAIEIPELRFDGPSVDLLRTGDNRNNWTFKHEQKKSKWTLDLERIALSRGVIHYKDAILHADVTADVDTIKDPLYGIGFKVHGSYNGAEASGGGKVGKVLALKNETAPFPVQADLRAGDSRLALEGTVTRPAKLSGLDLRLTLAGPSMARLYPFTGLTLPETPPFSTSGHLVGSLEEGSSQWNYDKFTGKVGSSDISGRLEYQTGKPHGKLTGNVRSHQLLFADLGPMIGSSSHASKEKGPSPKVHPDGKVLPSERFRTERWGRIDADVHFAAERIVRNKNLPINKLSTHLVMKNGVIDLEPLDFGIAGGTVSSNIKLDGSGKDTIKATARITARHLQLKELFPAVQKMKASVGEVNGDAKLSSTGNSVASLLGHSNGELKTLVSEGALSKLLLEEMGLNVGNVIVTKLFGDRQVQLNCLASDFDIKNGLMQTQTFVMDTNEAVVNIGGNVNLASEELDLKVNPQTKSLRLFTLRSPFYVKGTLGKPDVSVDKKVLAMKGAAALALAAVTPIAALLPLINTGPGHDSHCAQLLADAKVKPTAPPPGKTKQ